MTLRELDAAAKAKQRYDWDHTAEQLALMATLKTGNRYTRDDFHPTRERPAQRFDIDDPGAEYERLVKEREKRKGKHKK